MHDLNQKDKSIFVYSFLFNFEIKRTFWNKFQGVTEYSKSRSFPTWAITKKLMAKAIAAFSIRYLEYNYI